MGDFGTICVTVPHERFLYGEFHDDMVSLVASGLRPGDSVFQIRNKPTHLARNELARHFLRTCRLMEEDGKEPFGALCFIDSDMRFASDTLHRLRSNEGNTEYDIVQAWYCCKGWPPYPVMMKRTEEDREWGVEGWWFQWMQRGLDWEWGDLVECDGVGGGFTIVRREVFEALEGDLEPDKALFFEYRGDHTEDLWFCKHAREQGFRIAVDTRVTCGHIYHAYWGPDQYNKWRNGVDQKVYDERGRHVLASTEDTPGGKRELKEVITLVGFDD